MHTLNRNRRIVLILVLSLLSASCALRERYTENALTIKDSDLATISASCHAQYVELKKRLNLAAYREHIMENGDGIDNTYRYDLGARWLFIEVHEESGHINRMYFAPKTGN